MSKYRGAFILTLAMLSGIAGIAYEVLYVRLFAAYLGDIFYVSAILIATFFAGIAIGSYISRQYTPYLKYVELFIGLYGLGLAVLFKTFGLSITERIVNLPIESVIILPLFVFLTLIPPSTAIGFSVPLFAMYVKKYWRQRGAFSATYAVYNIGAAAAVILIEYGLVRTIGISGSLLWIASINLFIGASLFWIKSPLAAARMRWRGLPHAMRRMLIILGAASIISGVLQVNTFSLYQRLIGPLNENIALIIGAALLSIAIASWYTEKRKVSFLFAIALLPFATLLSFLFLHIYILGFSYLSTYVATSYTAMIAARSLLVLAVLVPLSVAYSLTIPVLVRQYGMQYSGIALAVSAAGNTLGYVLYIFIIFEQLGYIAVILGAAVVAFALFIWLALKEKVSFSLVPVSGAAFAALCIMFVLLWPSYAAHISYVHLYNLNEFRARIRTSSPLHIFKKYGSDAVITARGDKKILILNGYHTLTFDSSKSAVVRESLLGILPAFFAEQRKRALLFGLGSGLTASAAADMFESLTVAEINPAMLDIARVLETENGRVLDKKNISIEIQDGLIALLTGTSTYDTIINSVPTPTYFSANKLWTRDIYDLVTSRLSEHGVYSGWVDLRLGQEGFEIMTNTLEESFKHCVYMYLNTAYFGFVCGTQPLEFHALSDEKIPVLFADIVRPRLPKNTPMNEFIRNLLFAFPEKNWTEDRINTLDTPFLEYVYILGNVVEKQANAVWYMHSLSAGINADDPFTGIKRDAKLQCSALRAVDPFYTCKKELDT